MVNGIRRPLRQVGIPPRQQHIERQGPVSKHYAIILTDLTKPKGHAERETLLLVTSTFCGKPVTEDMLLQEVKGLNRLCGLHGGTCRSLDGDRKLTFRLQTS